MRMKELDIEGMVRVEWYDILIHTIQFALVPHKVAQDLVAAYPDVYTIKPI